VTEILIYVITVPEVSASAIGSLSSIPYSWFSLDNINLGYIQNMVIIQFNYSTLKINKIRLIRRVFERNSRIWQKKASLCLVKRDINR